MAQDRRKAAARTVEPFRHRILVHAFGDDEVNPYLMLLCECGWASDEYDALSPAQAWSIERQHLSDSFRLRKGLVSPHGTSEGEG